MVCGWSVGGGFILRQRKRLSRSDIIAITGHASEKGLDSYDEGDERQQKTSSNIIDGITPNSRPSQGCFTANHRSPSVLTAPAHRPPLQISANVLQPRPRCMGINNISA